MKGFVTYYVYDSSVYLVPHYALPAELPSIINEYREAAVERRWELLTPSTG